jgi:hypothetical protein
VAGSLIREVRRAVLAHTKGTVPLVPVAQQHAGAVPANGNWPFTRLDSWRSASLDLSCVAGAALAFSQHVFAGPREERGVLVETAEDHAARIASALKLALHARRLVLEGGATARIMVRSVSLVRDGMEADAYHAILSCEARVLAA